MWIQLFVVFCLVHNPYLCRAIEMTPIDHAMTSTAECTKGGAIGGMQFTLEHMEWRVKGWRCTEKPKIMHTWMKPAF
jgi:hypothetical protein